MNQWERPPRDDDRFGKKPDAKAAATDVAAIQWRIEKWFPDIPAPTQKKLKSYHDELMKFNKGVNLISVKTIPQADAIHFADCILAARMIMGGNAMDEIYDFGSGNGFPGVVIGILYPSVKVHMVELDQRKAEFLKHCVALLGLSNCDVMIRAIESLPPSSVKFAVSRGYATITKGLLATRKVFSKGGKYFHMKSEEWASEVAQIPTQLCSFWAPALVGEYKLPVGEVKFSIVKTEKIVD